MAKVSVKTKDTIYGKAITEVTIRATVGDVLVIRQARQSCGGFGESLCLPWMGD